MDANNDSTDMKKIMEILMKRNELEDYIFSSKNPSRRVKPQLFQYMTEERIQKLIYYIGETIPYRYKEMASLLEECGRPTIQFNANDGFAKYLFSRGIINNSNIDSTSNTHSMGYYDYHSLLDESNPILVAIKNDDLISMLTLLKINDIQEKSTFATAMFFGSLKIVEYHILNGLKVTTYDITKAIKGGSEELFCFLLSNGYIYEPSLFKTAVSCHKNKIAIWLFPIINRIDIDLKFCYNSFNTEIMLFLIDNGYDINNYMSSTQESILHISSINNDLILAHFLLLKGADPSIKDSRGKTPYELAYSIQMKKLLKPPDE